MREIKFRAKYKDNKEWSHFTLKELIQNDGVMFDNYHDWYQYTGRKDKNGKEIYEGNIVKFRPYAGATDEYIGEIKWMNILSAFRITKKTIPKFNTAPECVWEIIGNIYENPELIE